MDTLLNPSFAAFFPSPWGDGFSPPQLAFAASDMPWDEGDARALDRLAPSRLPWRGWTGAGEPISRLAHALARAAGPRALEDRGNQGATLLIALWRSPPMESNEEASVGFCLVAQPGYDTGGQESYWDGVDLRALARDGGFSEWEATEEMSPDHGATSASAKALELARGQRAPASP